MNDPQECNSASCSDSPTVRVRGETVDQKTAWQYYCDVHWDEVMENTLRVHAMALVLVHTESILPTRPEGTA